jgi:MFS family permease
MAEPTIESAEKRPSHQPSEELSKLISWLAAGFLVLAGMLVTTVGAGLYTLVDRDLITELVAEGSITSPQLTDAELVDVSVALTTWGGIGLTVTGVLMIVAGVGFLLYRKRLLRQEIRERPDSITLAVVGAVVTGVTSFVPLSPLLGGLVAGYLGDGENWDGVRVGGYAGVVAALPVVLLFLFLLGGFLVTAGEIGLGGAAVVVSLGIVFALLFSVAIIVCLSGLGGYIGVRLRARNGRSEV